MLQKSGEVEGRCIQEAIGRAHRLSTRYTILRRTHPLIMVGDIRSRPADTSGRMIFSFCFPSSVMARSCGAYGNALFRTISNVPELGRAQLKKRARLIGLASCRRRSPCHCWMVLFPLLHPSQKKIAALYASSLKMGYCFLSIKIR